MSKATHEVHLHDPQTLYRHWEESQWSPWGIDLSSDREQWQTMDDRSLVSFVLGSLMVAEERITTKFSGLVGADGSEEEITCSWPKSVGLPTDRRSIRWVLVSRLRGRGRLTGRSRRTRLVVGVGQCTVVDESSGWVGAASWAGILSR